VATFFGNLPPCLIGMEACASAHHWARNLASLGHTVRLMAPQFVKPYVKTNKNDAADAEAICEAVARTAQANQIRGLLGEFGLVIPQGIANVTRRIPELLEDASNNLPGMLRSLINRLMAHLKDLDGQVGEIEGQIKTWHRESELSLRLEKIPGIGPITASALVATVGDARTFDNGRQLSAWMGLVPKQHSSGGKTNLQGISKRGDTYLRTLLIHGARSAILAAQRKTNCGDDWLCRLLQRRNPNVAAVALANKNARIVWALLAHGREFRFRYELADIAA
jgi:transposase